MVKILRDIIIRDDLRKIYGQPFGYQVKYLWRKGWEEIPEIMVFVPPTIVGLFGLVWLVRAQLEEAKRLPRYFDDITIFRPNDPKVARIRTDDRLSIESKH
ncbi:uncharacterized protein LOC100876711 [Megachile rotundata]|uniref:uncharacterized protein LOC100876711 n=1 Tax=Megachile rotundata TaxID=143995 RepID=UPI000258F64B|nr:PREDICTED: uncharacterized protein LOC100876711 [Megachile rotundata]